MARGKTRCLVALLVYLVSVIQGELTVFAQQEANPTKGQFTVLMVTELCRLRRDSEVRSLAYSMEGKWLASRDDKGSLVVCDALTGGEQYRLAPTVGVHFLPGSNVFLGHSEGKLKQWDLGTGKEVATLSFAANAIGSVSDGGILIGYEKGNVVLHELENGRIVKQFRIDRFGGAVSNLKIHSKNERLAHTDLKCNITIWNLITGQKLVTWKAADKRITSICFSPSGEAIASASFDNTIQIWNAKTGKLERRINARWLPVKIAYSPDGKWLAVGYGGNFRDVSVFDTTTGTEALTLQRAAWESTSTGAITFNPQGTHLAAATGRYVQVWEISTRKGVLNKGTPGAEKR